VIKSLLSISFSTLIQLNTLAALLWAMSPWYPWNRRLGRS